MTERYHVYLLEEHENTSEVVLASDYDALAARLAEAAEIIREYRDQRAIYLNAVDAATVAKCDAWLAGAGFNEERSQGNG